MKTSKHCVVSGTLAFAIFTGCAHPRPEGARLSAPEAIRIAKQAAELDGISLKRYKRPKARYLNDETWFVFYEGRGIFRTIGNHFAVCVDDQTGAQQIVHGE